MSTSSLPVALTPCGCRLNPSDDLADLIDVGAEITRLMKENEKTAGFIAAKQAKLAKGVATLAELKSRGPAGA